jgi:CubicO group peptidase (beta-lactamase class C family)
MKLLATLIASLFTLAARAEAPAQAHSKAPRLNVGEAIPVTELDALVDGVVRDAMAADHIEGVAVSVVQNGEIVLLKGYGLSRQQPATPVDPSRTLFRIGSVSKTFTWILLMREVERGKVRLDAPVNDYLPQELRIPTDGFERPIRVVDLMSHAAGFEDAALGHLFVDTPDRLLSAEEYVKRHRPRRVREPGLSSTYSNYGTALAGVIVARLNGLDFESLVERDILIPLKMSHTTFREPYPPIAGLPAPMPPALARNLSEGFHWTDSDFKPFKFDYVGHIAAVGSASTSVADMARYMLAQLNSGSLEGAVIYGPQTARALRTPIMKVPPGVNGWAHGFMIDSLPGGFVGYGHGGATMSFLSYMSVIPELRLGVFTASNTTTGMMLVQRLPKLIVDRFYAADSARRGTPDAALAKQADVYSGRYLATRRAYSGLEKFTGLLQAAAIVTVTPDGYLKTRLGPFDQTWVPDGRPGAFREVEGDERLTFQLGPDGRATSYLPQSGGFVMERANPLMSPQLFVMLAALTAIAAVTLWLVLIARGSDKNSSRWQLRADRLCLVVAAVWIVSMAAFAMFLAGTTDEEALIYEWPQTSIVVASAGALVASAGSLALLALLPVAWRGGRASLGRKMHYTFVAVVFVLFAADAALWGMLIPWM